MEFGSGLHGLLCQIPVVGSSQIRTCRLYTFSSFPRIGKAIQIVQSLPVSVQPSVVIVRGGGLHLVMVRSSVGEVTTRS